MASESPVDHTYALRPDVVATVLDHGACFWISEQVLLPAESVRLGDDAAVREPGLDRPTSSNAAENGARQMPMEGVRATVADDPRKPPFSRHLLAPRARSQEKRRLTGSRSGWSARPSPSSVSS